MSWTSKSSVNIGRLYDPENEPFSGRTASSLPPLSQTFPAYTKVNRRRRVTCNQCHQPFGYLTLDQSQIESCRSNSGVLSKATKDDRLVGAVQIRDPINILVRRRIESEENRLPISGQNLAFGAHVITTLMGDHFETEEAICTGCGLCVGVRITEFEEYPPAQKIDVENTTIGQQKDVRESNRWFTLSEDAIQLEPFFSLKSMTKQSVRYQGGERFYAEAVNIEDSPDFSNDSSTWMNSMARCPPQHTLPKASFIRSWPLFYIDIERVEALPTGIVGHQNAVDIARQVSLKAYEKPID